MSKPKPKRSAERIPSQLPATIRLADGSQRVLATTRDISSNGAFFFSKSKIDVGAEVELIMIMPPEIPEFANRWVCCQFKVVRVEESHGVYGIAGQITRIEALPQI